MNSLALEGKYRIMEAETEDILSSSLELEDGMVVLIESSDYREDPSKTDDPAALDRLLRENRWCEVTQLRRIRVGTDGPSIRFVGLYADGTKRTRTYSRNASWFIKKDSLPKEEDLENQDTANTDLVEYAEVDAEATMSMLPHERALTVTQEQLELVSEAVRDVIPEAEFKCEDEVWTLELTVDEPETVQVTQLGTGATANVPVSEFKSKQPRSFIDLNITGTINDFESSDGPLAKVDRRPYSLWDTYKSGVQTDQLLYHRNKPGL